MTQASTVTFVSGKGGSGKTVTSSAIGHLLASLGFRVLMVDTDASTNGLTLLFLAEVNMAKKANNQKSRGVFDLDPDDLIDLDFRGGITAVNKISISERLDFVPATFTLSQTDAVAPKTFRATLNYILAAAAEDAYSFILLDAQAGTDEYAKIAASLGDQVVIVSEFDPISAQGVDRVKILFSSVMRPENTWVLYNKVLPEFTTAIRDGLAVTRTLPPLGWNIDVIRAFAQRTLAIDINDPNEYTINISQISVALFGSVVSGAVNRWLQSIQNTRKEPLITDLDAVESEVNALQRAAIEAEFRVSRRKSLELFASIFYTIPLTFFLGLIFILTVDPDFLGILKYFKYKTIFGSSGISFDTFSLFSLSIMFVLFTMMKSLFGGNKVLEDLEKQKLIERRLNDLLERRQRLKIAAEKIDEINSRSSLKINL